MRPKMLLPFVLVVALAACGGSSKTAGAPPATSAPPGPTTSVHIAKQASDTPSESAKMICATEAVKAIEDQATGVAVLTPPSANATWKDHIYACEYRYPGGAKLTLAVKEMSSTDETTAYFNSLATKLGKTDDLSGVGQGGFSVRDGSVVVRKDYKVLLVDVTKLPAQFGVPADPRNKVAQNVAFTIMSCWTGA